jgi:hypothetical protein
MNRFVRLGFVGFLSFPPDVVLGSRIFGGRERKSWNREGEEAKELRCYSPELARTDPRRPCLGLARPTRPMPFSRPTPAEERENHGREKRKRQRSHDAVCPSSPMPGSGEIHGVGFARPRQRCFGLFLCGLICFFCFTLIFCNWRCVKMGLEAAKGTFCIWSEPKGLSNKKGETPLHVRTHFLHIHSVNFFFLF